MWTSSSPTKKTPPTCSTFMPPRRMWTPASSPSISIRPWPRKSRSSSRIFPRWRSRCARATPPRITTGARCCFDVATGKEVFAPLRDGAYEAYQIKNIVDRVGGGDSFGAGLIFAFNTPELSSPDKAIAFAVAASCLCHSIVGDVNFTSRAEVEALMKGSGSGRVVRRSLFSFRRNTSGLDQRWPGLLFFHEKREGLKEDWSGMCEVAARASESNQMVDGDASPRSP